MAKKQEQQLPVPDWYLKLEAEYLAALEGQQKAVVKDKNYERAQLLCNLLQTICEAANGVEEMETDAGTTRILSFRYKPTIEFYEDDVRIIKELAEEMGEEFPYIIEEQ